MKKDASRKGAAQGSDHAEQEQTMTPVRKTKAELTPGEVPTGDVLIMEYGVRIDKESAVAVQQQIAQSRRLYNLIIASIRQIVGDMNTFILSKAGPEATNVQTQIDALTERFAEAKARDDEPAMKQIAQERRQCWRELATILKAVRSEHKALIQTNYLSRIGRNTGCDPYRLRCEAVAAGLGWATANATLDHALLAFKQSFQLGRPPRFSVGSEKDQDTLTLQFTAAGGVAAETLLAGAHGELAIQPTQGCGRRKYGEFRFRLGAAKEATNATGTWQYHRPIPDGARVGLARLVRRRIGKDYRWALQLMIKLPAPVCEAVDKRKPLVVVHMGWAADIHGRRIAGITDSSDPGAAQVIQLPPAIEADLERAAAIQGERDAHRDAIVPQVKAIALPDDTPRAVQEIMASIRSLRPQYISANRLHYLCRMLNENDMLTDWLEQWRKDDRLRWQAHTHIARRARNARRDFYRNLAIKLARQYDAIVVEPLNLAEAAKKVNEKTGEKTEFSRKARAGRVVAALSELESAIRWAAVKAGAAVLDLAGETASICALCGATVQADAENHQILHCDGCGAVLDRKQNGAASAYQMASANREAAVNEFWLQRLERTKKQQHEQATRLTKMAQGRRTARTRRASEMAA